MTIDPKKALPEYAKPSQLILRAHFLVISA